MNYEAIPKVFFAVPPLASVGLTKAEARARGFDVSIITSDMANWKVYAIVGEPLAWAKVIIGSGSGRILGAHLLGRGTEENISLFTMPSNSASPLIGFAEGLEKPPGKIKTVLEMA